MLAAELEAKEERPAYVRFETRAVESKSKSLEAGRSVSVDVDYALVTPPYSKDLVVIKVSQWLDNTRRNVKNGRTPAAWLEHWEKAYNAFKNGKEAPLNGTSIKEWSAISPAQIKNLITLNILTIEDLAAVNDEGLKRIGMGSNELKRKAINWLDAAKDHGPIVMRATQLESENAQLKLSNSDLIAKNKALMTQLEALKQPVYAEVRRESVESISASDILDDDPVVDLREAKMDEMNDSSTELRLQYEAKFGKPPHHRMKEETIKEKLLE